MHRAPAIGLLVALARSAGKGELWIMASHGSQPRAVVEVGNAFGPASWAPDGRSLAIAAQPGPRTYRRGC